jgi:hypothetical protein
MSPNDEFDLIRVQQLVRETNSPAKLYSIWCDTLNSFEKRQISWFHVEEVRDLIYPAIARLERLEKDLELTTSTV